MNKKRNLIIALSLNLLIIVLEVVALCMNLRGTGWSTFRFYTQDSNVVAMFACACMAAYQIMCLSGKRESVARWAIVFKYISVCLVSVTFLVVLFVLGPSTGSFSGFMTMFLYGSMLYQHFLCPVLAFVSFVFFEDGAGLRKFDSVLALIPTALYAVVVAILNILRVMEGPYLFFMVYEQPVYMSFVWFIVIVGGAYGIAYLTYLSKAKRGIRLRIESAAGNAAL